MAVEPKLGTNDTDIYQIYSYAPNKAHLWEKMDRYEKGSLPFVHLIAGLSFVIGRGGLEGNGIVFLVREPKVRAVQPEERLARMKRGLYLFWQVFGIADTWPFLIAVQGEISVCCCRS